MDLTAELDELSHGLHRQRRLIELTVNRVHLAALVLEQRNELPPTVGLDEVHRVLAHLHHEDMFRAILVSGISGALGTCRDPDLLEIIASAPSMASTRLTDRRARLVRAIDAADALVDRLRLNALEPSTSRHSAATCGGRDGNVIVLEPRTDVYDLTDTARRVVQPSLRDFICRSA